MLTEQRKREIFKEEYTRNLKARLTAKRKLPIVKEYLCKYCNKLARTPETECYLNPNNPKSHVK